VLRLISSTCLFFSKSYRASNVTEDIGLIKSTTHSAKNNTEGEFM